MKARVIDSFPAPTLDEIKRFEARNGVVLPEEYVDFWLASNGGLFTGEYALVGPPSDDRVDGLKALLAQNAVDFAETSRNGLPLLTLAARRRQPEVCRLLIEAGPTSTKRTPTERRRFISRRASTLSIS